MSRDAVRAIARKDLMTVVRNRGVRTPLIVTPIVVLGVLPVALVGGGEVLAASQPIQEAVAAGGGERFQPLVDTASSWLNQGTIPVGARWGMFILDTFVAPLYLLIPLITATVIAADSFAGERERGTLEALLHAATTDRDLLWGKFLAAFIPALSVAWASFIGYTLLANGLLWRHLGGPWFPTTTWVLLAAWAAPAVAALGLSLMVIASSKVNSLQAAHQIGSLVILPVMLLLVANLTGSLLLRPSLVIVMGALIGLLAAGLLGVAARSLRRERLAARL